MPRVGMTGASEWSNLLLGGGGVGGSVLGLVLWGKLQPSWVVNRDRAALVAAHNKSVDDLSASHLRELAQLEKARTDALAVRDREMARLVQEKDYEREARGIERDRADANGSRVADLARELGETSLHLLRALPEAARE